MTPSVRGALRARFSRRFPASNPLHGRRTSRKFRPEPLEDRLLLALVPELVADIDPTGTFGEISQIVALGDVALLVADDGVHGAELWRSDGTSVGTQLLIDLNPAGGSSPQMMAPLGGYWLFTADDGEHGRELWRTDGTPEGTELFWDSAEGAESRFQFPSGNVTAQSSAWMYFSLKGVEEQTEIWRTDGTSSGTRLLRSLEIHGVPPSTSGGIREMVVTSDDDLFFVYDDGLIGRELWRLFPTDDEQSPWETQSFNISNAIVDGMQLDGEPRELTAIGDRVYFSAYNVFFGREVWRSSSIGLQPIDLVPGPGHSHPDRFTGFGFDAYFLVLDPVAGRQGLWKGNFDPNQFARVKELPYFELSGAGTGLDRNLVATEDHLFFVASDGAYNPGRRLWTSDGTTDGTSVVAEFPGFAEGPRVPLINDMTALGTKLFFSGETAELGRELWVSDGTIDGTTVVRDIQLGPGDALPSHLTAVGDRLFFTANDGINGSRLWTSDGTADGTAAIEIANQNGYGSRPQQITKVGDSIFFAADDGVHGRELWKTDGTANGTTMVADLVPGERGSLGQRLDSIGPFTAVGDDLYFVPSIWLEWPWHRYKEQLWRSDGTASGTRSMMDALPDDTYVYSRSSLKAVNKTLYFAAESPLSEPFDGLSELWSIKENDAQATRLGSMGVYQDYTIDPRPLFDTLPGGAVFLDAPDSSDRRDAILYFTDGTLAGTRRLAYLPDQSEITEIVVAGDSVYFVDRRYPAARLYRYSFETQELALLRELELLQSDRLDFGLINVDGTLYFTLDTFRDGQEGFELWTSDGTTEGTRLVKDFRTGSFVFYPTQFTALNGVLYFSMFDEEHGEELWRSDGTPDGTRVVADIAPGGLSSFPTNLAVVGDVLYFSADDATHGAELWRSDGTSEGTVLVADLRTGTGPDGNSYPHDITFIDGSLYFGARDRLHGDELWRIRPAEGDTNLDGQVDIEDLNNVRNHFGGTGLGDADGDGDVDLDDLNLVRNNFGGGSAAPSVRPRDADRREKRSGLAPENSWERAVDLLFTGDRLAAGNIEDLVGPRKLRKSWRA